MQKPAYTESIVPVFAGQTVPPALLLKLLTENRSATGFVVQDTSAGLIVEKFHEMDAVEDEMKEWTGNLESTKKFNRMVCFSAFPEKFDPAEVQPWTILKNSKDEPILVVACEGDFFEHTGNNHSEFYNLVHDYLGPKIEEMYALLNNDVKKVMEWLKTTGFHHDLEKHFGERAVFEFMTTEGPPYTYGKNEIGGEFDWGRASNVYGYPGSAQEAATPATAEPEKKRSRYAADTPDTPLPDGVQRIPDKPVVVPPQADPAPGKDPIKEAAAKAVTGHWVGIPKNLHGKRKKAFIRNLHPTQDLDPAWGNLTRVWVEHETTVNSLADLSKTAAGAAVKDMKAAGPSPAAAVERVIPVISGAEQAQAIAFIKKYLDGNSNRVGNPLEIQKSEAKLPVFTELAGRENGLDYFDSCTASVLKTFIAERPESAWLLMLEYRSDRRKRKQLQALGDKKLSDLTGTEQPVETPVTPAIPAPDPIAAPAEAPAEVPYKKSRYA